MHRRIRRLALAAFAVIPALALSGTFALLSNGDAQEPAKKQQPIAKEAPAAPAKRAEPAAAPPPPQVAMPEAEKIVLLTRTTLLTLNDALHTGNFTVLRDMAAPGFREANSAARLSAVFGNLMAQHVDLTAVAILAPQLVEAPVLDQKNGMVRIRGYFPARPIRIDFEVIYQAVDGRWRLFGLSVQPIAHASVAESPPPVADRAAEAQKAPAPPNK
jgi:hypothetical protein